MNFGDSGMMFPPYLTVIKYLVAGCAGCLGLSAWAVLSVLPPDLTQATGLGVLALFGWLGYKLVDRWIAKQPVAPTARDAREDAYSSAEDRENFRAIRSELGTIADLLTRSVTLQEENSRSTAEIRRNMHRTNNQLMKIMAMALVKDPKVIETLLRESLDNGEAMTL